MTVIKLLKALFNRITILILLVLIEAGLLFMTFRFFKLNEHWAAIEAVMRVLSVVISLTVAKKSRHLSSDVGWIIIIILLPVPGTILYLFAGAHFNIGATTRSIIRETETAERYYRQDPEVYAELTDTAPEIAGQFHYIAESAGFPFYRNEGFSYYPLGEDGFPVMLEELRKAEKFIFLEYFIIEPGEMWNSMLDVLKEKAAKGVEVRMLYDDMGSMKTLPWAYARDLEAFGIRCVPFNRINPVIQGIMNHRDHRKILVIDGRCAFSGGINLADEYINKKSRFGHWKDNVIRVRGEAVWSYTVMFLTMWNALRHEDTDFTVYKTAYFPEIAEQRKENAADGFIAPYGETPLDAEITSQDIYMNILNQAARYCYIFTPYLIIDEELINALILAAKRGVDVRIITPGIPDKKLVFKVTRSYYRQLIGGGVKIYEYTPGFVHGKVFVSDDRIATVGTINLDYRSLYLHFENGTYLFGAKEVTEIRDDFLAAAAVSHRVDPEEIKTGILRSFGMSVIRLFAAQL